jgi:hypothetical protein
MTDDCLHVDDTGTVWLGTRRIAWGQLHQATTGLANTRFEERRYTVPFENGWRITIVWGSCSFSDNLHLGGNPFTEEPCLVEVAVHSPAGAMIPFPDGNDIAGYVPVHHVAELIDTVATWPTTRQGDWPVAFT